MAHLEGEWPYFRENPDCVVLGVKPGVTPSDKPPVRIFLGTEEGQYRAERIFVYSVEKHRDPSRVYEVHLMKNVTGFDRRGWRTGFTCYRFAIPDFAGRQGKAIYNDVDQIYLTDPARLFDLDMNGHGYLAIDARDTSVMLIDCEKMLPWWNRAAASKRGAKGPLTKGPAKVPGLWGQLDPHWNARDLEYVEGRTMCLHYTALHQQPWNPFPDVYSYHANPLAYLWHDLEREADAEGFEVFTRDNPSPGLMAVLGSNWPRASEAKPAGPLLSPAAARFLQGVGAERLLVTALDGAAEAELGNGSLTVTRHDFGRAAGCPPDERFDAVLAAGIFERIPGADVGWTLREIFGTADRAVVLRIATQAVEGVGSAPWWRRRVEEIASHFPAVSWNLDAVERLPTGSFRVNSTQVRRVAAPPEPVVWALTGESEAKDRQVRRVAAALGWPFQEKHLAYGPLAALPNGALGTSLHSIDRNSSARLEAPWPDIVIMSGRRAVPVARWIRRQAAGRTRLVQLGRPGGPFSLFDLIIATPDDRLPIRANVLQVAAPPGEPPGEPESSAWQERLEDLPHPRLALFLTGRTSPYLMSEASARELGRLASAEASRDGGSLVICADVSTPARAVEAVRSSVGCPVLVAEPPSSDADDPYAPLLGLADGFIVTAGNPQALAEACLTGKPVALFELPRRGEDRPLLRPIARLVLPLIGGKTYRGTPLQQHFPGRIIDWLITRGLLYRPRDLDALHRSLEARGLVTRLGHGEPVASPKPLDDLDRIATRIRRLLSEVSQPA